MGILQYRLADNGSIKDRICKATGGFTFAEVFVTIIIVGIVTAMVIPALINDISDAKTKVSLKETYSVLNQALKRAELDNSNIPIRCYYWNTRPYPGPSTCASYDETGECTKRVLPDGSEEPDDYMGPRAECNLLLPVMKNYMSVSKTCAAGTAVSGGCIWAYKGVDRVALDNNPTYTPYDAKKATSTCPGFRTNQFALKEAFILNNGIAIIPYDSTFGGNNPLIAVDVNGKKAPNKAGYDLFFFTVKGTTGSDLKFVPGGCEYTEAGGKTTSTYLYSGS